MTTIHEEYAAARVRSALNYAGLNPHSFRWTVVLNYHSERQDVRWIGADRERHEMPCPKTNEEWAALVAAIKLTI